MSAVTRPAVRTGAYVLDPAQARIGFSVRLALITKVRGSFDKFDGDGYFDAQNPGNSKLQLTIAARSIETQNAKRDAHLRSSAFLDTASHTEINFVSTSVQQVSTERYRVTGDLTIKGTTKPVTIDVELVSDAVDQRGNHRIMLRGEATVSRKTWGVTTGGVFIGDKVKVDCELSAYEAEGS